MEWINGMQRALAYIEEHLTEEIDYEEVAKQSFSSSFHFQRVFSILCGYTLGEYIRNRRLTLAGAELQSENAKVIDVALKYGYESPDSFAKAFQKFHGILPSQARREKAMLKAFTRLSIQVIMEGGTVMNYRIENKPEMVLTGYKRRFTGTPAERNEQEGKFYLSTRVNQFILNGLSKDCETSYNVITNFGDDGYDYYIAAKLDTNTTNHLARALGSKEEAKRFETITIPAGEYLVCETERMRYPVTQTEEVRRKAVSEWLPSSEYELTDAPEIAVNHWFYRENDPVYNQSRYIELWLPIVKNKSPHH